MNIKFQLATYGWISRQGLANTNRVFPNLTNSSTQEEAYAIILIDGIETRYSTIFIH